MEPGPGPGDVVVPAGKELVVFAGSEDTGCAQMAAAWFGMLADPEKAHAVVAGRRTPTRLASHLVAAMAEIGVDWKNVLARPLSPALLKSADLVVTIGDSFERGFLSTSAPLHREHWMVQPEPAHADGPGRARNLRDLVRSRVAMLVFSEGWGRGDISREAARVTRPRWHSEASSSY